ncbi:hypothetical protein [Streptantibioticus silvisoli]|uniref:Uncharacterized protein n=1 Tax=Streptantibioticus silvisoli TaxID=2705255 RepID=A0ABT6VZX1_9ACTN|nr:hypothetical protein [Streptantibioticus silvisoli]MDI5964042.1 hypothetical protein [Streptantibioticus silvisoli]
MKNELIASTIESAIHPEIPPPESLDVSPVGSAAGVVGAVDAGAGERGLGEEAGDAVAVGAAGGAG